MNQLNGIQYEYIISSTFEKAQRRKVRSMFTKSQTMYEENIEKEDKARFRVNKSRLRCHSVKSHLMIFDIFISLTLQTFFFSVFQTHQSWCFS